MFVVEKIVISNGKDSGFGKLEFAFTHTNKAGEILHYVALYSDSGTMEFEQQVVNASSLLCYVDGLRQNQLVAIIIRAVYQDGHIFEGDLHWIEMGPSKKACNILLLL